MLVGFQKRFFMLMNDKLAYFEQESDIDPKGAIELKDVTNISVIDAMDFSIELKHRNVHLRASSEANRNQWI